ncbi:MAG: hypothetical protein PVG90_00420 [Bacillota bacterium]|jgi:hypothetical protein
MLQSKITVGAANNYSADSTQAATATAIPSVTAIAIPSATPTGRPDEDEWKNNQGTITLGTTIRTYSKTNWKKRAAVDRLTL